MSLSAKEKAKISCDAGNLLWLPKENLLKISVI